MRVCHLSTVGHLCVSCGIGACCEGGVGMALANSEGPLVNMDVQRQYMLLDTEPNPVRLPL